MFKWLKDLWHAKVSITIVHPASTGVISTATPRVVDDSRSNIARVRKSNFRFAEHSVTEEGRTRTYYYTEQYNGHSWYQVNGSWFSEKDRALRAHLQLVETGVIDCPVKVTTVLWEGLSPEETKTWVEVNMPLIKEE